MFERPNIFKVPSIVDNNFTVGACGGYKVSCETNYKSGCVDGGFSDEGSSSSIPTTVLVSAGTAIAVVVIVT